MLRNFASSNFMVVDINDQIETVDKGASSSSGMYEDFIKLCDEQISKALLYSTMILDDGSSRSQAEVQERNVNLLIDSYISMIEHVTNNDLIPRMAKIGFNINENEEIQFDGQPEKAQEKINKYNMLLQYYDIDPGTIKEEFNVIVEEKINTNE